MNLQSRPCCRFCNRRDPALLDCGGCGKVSYCNKGCQHRDWKNHKSECGHKPAGRPGFECWAGDKTDSKRKGHTGVECLALATIPGDITEKCDFLYKLATIPDDMKEKCDFLDRKDAERRAGREVFDVLVQDDEPGWEGNSITLRLEKLCEHMENLGYSQFDFYSSLKSVMYKRESSDRVRRWTNARAREYDELLEVSILVGLSEEEGKQALNVVGRWRKVPHSNGKNG